MKNLIEELRACVKMHPLDIDLDVLLEAADVIERQESEITMLKEQADMFVWLRDSCHLFEHYKAIKHRANAFEEDIRHAMRNEVTGK